MQIPAATVYQLLCHAWDKLEERDIVRVRTSTREDLLNLLARVLAAGASHVIRRGLDRAYAGRSEETKNPRGRIDFHGTLKRNLPARRQVACEFDDFDHNVFHNRMLKTALGHLASLPAVAPAVRRELLSLHGRMHSLGTIRSHGPLMPRLHFHSNNYFYDFLLRVCAVVLRNVSPDERTGRPAFRDFSRDAAVMSGVFDDFALHFFVRELGPLWTGARVDIGSGAAEECASGTVTAVRLEGPEGRTIVVRARFTGGDAADAEEALPLSRWMARNAGDRGCEGVLLCGSAGITADERRTGRPPVRIVTVDLAREWQEVRAAVLHATS